MIECLAYGWGWSENKLDNQTPKYICQTWIGKRNEIELRERKEWERARTLGTWILIPHSKKGLTPDKLMKFDWDKQKAKTKEEYYKENAHLRSEWEKLKQ